MDQSGQESGSIVYLGLRVKCCRIVIAVRSSLPKLARSARRARHPRRLENSGNTRHNPCLSVMFSSLPGQPDITQIFSHSLIWYRFVMVMICYLIRYAGQGTDYRGTSRSGQGTAVGDPTGLENGSIRSGSTLSKRGRSVKRSPRCSQYVIKNTVSWSK